MLGARCAVGERGDRDLIAAGLEFEKRAGGDKAVAADPLPSHDALEQARRAAGIDATASSNWRQHVAEHAAIDRHKLHALGQFAERVKIGVMSHEQEAVGRRLWTVKMKEDLGRPRFAIRPRAQFSCA